MFSKVTSLLVVVIEFGHNDGGSPASSDRAEVGGEGTDTQTVTLTNGTVEVVQTFNKVVENISELSSVSTELKVPQNASGPALLISTQTLPDQLSRANRAQNVRTEIANLPS